LHTYFESCASIVKAVVPPALLLSRPNQSTVAVRSRNLFKFTLAHEVVAAVVSHKHHSIICVGAGLIQFVYGLHSRLARTSSSTKFYFHHVFCRLFHHIYTLICIYIREYICIYLHIYTWARMHGCMCIFCRECGMHSDRCSEHHACAGVYVKQVLCAY